MVSVSQIRMPSHTIVNIEATGGSQAARLRTAVLAAATSTTSFGVTIINRFPSDVWCGGFLGGPRCEEHNSIDENWNYTHDYANDGGD